MYSINNKCLTENCDLIKPLVESEIEATEKIFDILSNFSLGNRDNSFMFLSEPEDHSLRQEYTVEDLKKIVIPILVLDRYSHLTRIMKYKKIDLLLQRMNENNLLIFFTEDSIKEFIEDKMDIPRSLIRHINHYSILSEMESKGEVFRTYELWYKELRIPECIFMVRKRSIENYLDML